jgi:pimeloyl-ACP methyl ester carboxylesterase
MTTAGSATPDALPAPRASWAFRPPVAGLWLRPWFDRLALRFIVRTYFPLSRGWAAAAEPGQTPGRFADRFDLPVTAELAAAIAAVAASRDGYEQAALRWRQVLFGAPVPASAAVAAERARAAAAHRFMATRQGFAPWRRRLPPVRWSLAAPAAMAARHGQRLAGPAYAEPAALPLRRSAVLPSGLGQESWLSFRSPLLGDEVMARVTEPAGGRADATLVALHGICMEPEMWRPTADPIAGLAAAGWRVVRPEGPWHGRRRLPGHYGGEPVMAWGLEGFLALFQAWIGEVGALIHWAREQGGPVALCGTSLGALTAQLYASLARGWSRALTPDALLLLTTSGQLLGAAYEGAIARRIGAPEQLAAAGWRPADIAPWLALIEPGESAVPPERTVLLLGSADSVTPYAGGLDLARRWGLPPANLFRQWRGHFSASLALGADPRPLRRLAEVLRQAPAG